MQITSKEIAQYFNIEVEDGLDLYAGLSNSHIPQTITFCDTEKFVRQIQENEHIKALIVTKELKNAVSRDELLLIESEDPRFDFYHLLNQLGERDATNWNSQISDSAVIHPTAFVSDTNVKIGDGTVVEPNVTILPDVEIGKNCIIRAGAVLGSEGFEQKRTSRGILHVKHFGKVIIGNEVHIGSLTGIAKGTPFRDTIVGDSSRIDNLIHIAHGAQIGSRCLLAATCMIAGSVTMGDDVWVGPNANVSSGLSVGNGAFITLGAVVTRNVGPGEKVSGNFAIPHDKFLKHIKSLL